jgi:hypothetical protein
MATGQKSRGERATLRRAPAWSAYWRSSQPLPAAVKPVTRPLEAQRAALGPKSLLPPSCPLKGRQRASLRRQAARLQPRSAPQLPARAQSSPCRLENARSGRRLDQARSRCRRALAANRLKVTLVLDADELAAVPVAEGRPRVKLRIRLPDRKLSADMGPSRCARRRRRFARWADNVALVLRGCLVEGDVIAEAGLSAQPKAKHGSDAANGN